MLVTLFDKPDDPLKVRCLIDRDLRPSLHRPCCHLEGFDLEFLPQVGFVLLTSFGEDHTIRHQKSEQLILVFVTGTPVHLLGRNIRPAQYLLFQ